MHIQAFKELPENPPVKCFVQHSRCKTPANGSSRRWKAELSAVMLKSALKKKTVIWDGCQQWRVPDAAEPRILTVVCLKVTRSRNFVLLFCLLKRAWGSQLRIADIDFQIENGEVLNFYDAWNVSIKME